MKKFPEGFYGVELRLPINLKVDGTLEVRDGQFLMLPELILMQM